MVIIMEGILMNGPMPPPPIMIEANTRPDSQQHSGKCCNVHVSTFNYA